MAEFLDEQAEVSENEEEDEGPARKKAKRKVVSSDEDDEEEEEEDDEQKIAEEMGGFVVSGDEDEEEEGAASEKSNESDEDDELSDEDLNLLNENLGESAPKRKSRVRIEDEDEAQNEKDRIADTLFDNENEEGLPDLGVDEPHGPYGRPEDEEDRSSESGMSDEGMEGFIAPEPGEAPVQRRKSNKLPISNAQLDEAREIFGVDFEYGKFFGDEDEEQVEEDEEEFGEGFGEDEDEEGERIRRPRMRKKQAKDSLLEHIEPAEIERGFLSEQDSRIQLEDKPERFQLRRVPVTEADKEELDAESNWIYQMAFCSATLSLQEQDQEVQNCLQINPAETVKKIYQALDFMRCQNFEVPFVAFYRKEYVETELGINDLWKVYQWDEKWCQLQSRKKNLIALYRRMQNYQFEKMSRDPSEQLTDDVRLISEDDFSALEGLSSLDELQDYVAQFMLYYGTDVPKMAVWEKEKIRDHSEMTSFLRSTIG